MSFIKFLNESKEYPTGVYVAVSLDDESSKLVKQYQTDNLSDNINEDLHCTLIYSAKPHKEKVQTSSLIHEAIFDGFELFGPDKDTLVMKLKCNSLINRNVELIKQHKFISNYDYNPHITLSYDAKDMNVSALPDFKGIITLENEYAEDLNLDWENK